jgi:hypothetical protein
MGSDKRTPRQKLNHLALVPCTDNKKAVKYLNGFDTKLYNTDVGMCFSPFASVYHLYSNLFLVDDWFAEGLEIQAVHFRLKLAFVLVEQFTYGMFDNPISN